MHVMPAVSCLVATIGLTSGAASAQSVSDAFMQGSVGGELRYYYINHDFSGAKPLQDAMAAAIHFNVQSGTFDNGFSVGASLISGNALGTQHSNPARVFNALLGPGNSVTALSQAFGQYQRPRWLLRVGYQYLDTPWMGKSDGLVLPASYEAIKLDVALNSDWHVLAMRTFGWKSRTSDSYHFDNLYFPHTADGDALYNGLGGLPDDARSVRGTWAIGSRYEHQQVQVQGWYYDFLQFSRMLYLQGQYTVKTGSALEPFVKLQYVHEGSGSGSDLARYGWVLLPDGAPGTQVRNRTWGTEFGVNIPHGEFDVAYNHAARDQGAVGAGMLISPYTAGYLTDPLFTTGLIHGLVELGPGHARRSAFTYHLLGDQLMLQVAYMKYDVTFFGRSHDSYCKVTYDLQGRLEGLSLTARWEHASGGINDMDPGNRPYVDTRFQLDYVF